MKKKKLKLSDTAGESHVIKSTSPPQHETRLDAYSDILIAKTAALANEVMEDTDNKLSSALNDIFNKKFESCWEELKRTESDKISRVKKNFVHEIASDAYNMMSYTVPKTIGAPIPPINDVIKFVFYTHYFNTEHLSDSERASMQRSAEYKHKLLMDASGPMIYSNVLSVEHLPKGTRYSPEIYTCEVLCDQYLPRVGIILGAQEKTNELKPVLLNVLITRALLLVKNILRQLTYSLPSEAFISWRTLFELEYIILALTSYSNELSELYSIFGEFAFLDDEGDEEKWEECKRYAEHFNAKNTPAFRNYGWILAINKELNPSLKSLVKICNDEERYQAFKDASKFTHVSSRSFKTDQNTVYRFIIGQLGLSMDNLDRAITSLFKQYDLQIPNESEFPFNLARKRFDKVQNEFWKWHLK